MAALAAGVATSMAQNVYSLNIVGYYNVPVNGALTAIGAQLLAGTPQNRMDQIGIYNDGDNFNLFNGVGFKEYDMDSGSPTGWTDPSTGNPIALTDLPILAPGKGFFYGKAGGVTNLTFVGTVATGTNNVNITSGLQMYSSMIPYSGNITTTNASNSINCPVPDGSAVQIYNGVGFTETDRDSGSPTGWTDAASGGPTTEPQIKVGQGFFINNAAAPVNWQQVLNP